MGYSLVFIFLLILAGWSFLTLMKNMGKPAKQRTSQNSLEVVLCPKCSTYLPDIARAQNLLQWLLARRTCPHCDCVMDKEGNFIK